MTDQLPDYLAKIRAAEAARQIYDGTHDGRNQFYALATDPEHGLAALAERLWEVEQKRDEFDQCLEAVTAERDVLFADRDALRQRVQDFLDEERNYLDSAQVFKLRAALAAVGGEK